MRYTLISTATLAILSTTNGVEATGYDLATGMKAFYYAAAAYCNQDLLSKWNCGEACSSENGVIDFTRITDDSRGTFGYVAYNQERNEALVAFRGSVNIENWITNLNFLQTPYPGSTTGASVHEGFFQAYLATEN